MFNADEDATVKTTTIEVEPVSVNGKAVECKITGDDVADDAIFLGLNQGYDLTFKLVNAGSLVFHQAKPFCNQKGKCPPELPGGSAHNPYSVTPISPTSIAVHCSPVNLRQVAHYRLNFDDGSSCDPIIIHD